MSDIFESKSFAVPSEVKGDLAASLKKSKGVRSVEFLFKGDELKGARQFGNTLIALRKRGVKISHEFSIKLDFPRKLSRRTALALFECMPKSVNGSMKIRMRLRSSAPASGGSDED